MLYMLKSVIGHASPLNRSRLEPEDVQRQVRSVPIDQSSSPLESGSQGPPHQDTRSESRQASRSIG